MAGQSSIAPCAARFRTCFSQAVIFATQPEVVQDVVKRLDFGTARTCPQTPSHQPDTANDGILVFFLKSAKLRTISSIGFTGQDLACLAGCQ